MDIRKIEKDMDALKKIGCFFGLFLYAIGVIGGIGVSLHEHSYIITAAILVLGAMAFPTAKTLFRYLTEG